MIMSTYRTQVRIVADVLSCASHNYSGDRGVGITHILQKANLSYTRLTHILNRLVTAGLLEQIHVNNNNRYIISDKGIQFLQSYSEFAEFAESFGMKL